MQCRLVQDTVVVSGEINELSKAADLLGALKQAEQAALGQRIRVCFEDVAHIDSNGLRVLYQSFKQAPSPMVLLDVPVCLVDQLNMLPSLFADGNVIIESFYALYYNEKLDKMLSFKLRVGVDIPVLESYEGFTPQPIRQGDVFFEPDFDAEEYFSFLTNCNNGLNAKS